MCQYNELEHVLGEYAGDKGGLITILQKAQEIYGYLSEGLMRHVAQRTGIAPAKIYGVATFYAQFRTRPAGKNKILLCQGTACHVNGSAGIESAVKEILGVDEDETTEDGLFTYNNVACLGCCSFSPAMMINGKVYGSLTPDKTKEIISDIRRNE